MQLTITRTVGVINLSQFLQPPPRKYILIRYFSFFNMTLNPALDKFKLKRQLKTFAGFCKNCAMVACRPDTDPAKEPKLLPAAGATNVYYHNRLAVSSHSPYQYDSQL